MILGNLSPLEEYLAFRGVSVFSCCGCTALSGASIIVLFGVSDLLRLVPDCRASLDIVLHVISAHLSILTLIDIGLYCKCT